MRSKGSTTRLHKIRSVTRLRTAIFICGLFLLFMPDVHWWHEEGDNRFTVFLNGFEMGTVEDADIVPELFRDARRELAAEREGMSFLRLTELDTTGEELIRGDIDDLSTVRRNIKTAISSEITSGYSKAYSIKVGETMVNVAGAEEARKLLQET